MNHGNNVRDISVDAAASDNASGSDAVNGPNDAVQSADGAIAMVAGAAIGCLVIAGIVSTAVFLAKRKRSGKKEETEMAKKVGIPEVSASIDIDGAGSDGNGTARGH